MEVSADIHKSIITRKRINGVMLWYGSLPPPPMWTGEHSEPLMSHLHSPKRLSPSPWNAVTSQCSAHSCFAWLLHGVWVSPETQGLFPTQQLYWDPWAEVPNWVCFSPALPLSASDTVSRLLRSTRQESFFPLPWKLRGRHAFPSRAN